MIKRNILDVLPERAERIAGVDISLLFGDARQRYYLCELPPGHRASAHYHRYGSEIYYIAAGSGTLYTRFHGIVQHQTVSEGDLIRLAPHTAHQLINDNARPLRLMFICRGTHVELDHIDIGDLDRMDAGVPSLAGR